MIQTFEGCSFRQHQDCVSGSNSVLCVSSSWRHHAVEGGHPVSDVELARDCDTCTQSMDRAGNVISTVEGYVQRCKVEPVC